MLFLTLLVTLVQAGPDLPDDSFAEVRRFAPIIWLAQNEAAYPVLPHPFAFDNIDNNCDGVLDMEDPAEIAVDLRLEQLLEIFSEARRTEAQKEAASCERGRWKAYAPDGKGGLIKPQPRVLFVDRVDRDRVPGWNRNRRADPPTWSSAIPVDTALIQYWLYYPIDIGPNPHLHDGEHVSVFTRARSGEVAGRLRGVVGAGHESGNVNNMLVAPVGGVLPAPNYLLPQRLPNHMPILVELGKHASAPDINCDGRFDLGADANVYSESAWGTRDVWATAGKALKVGRFQSWYSFPRSRSDRLLVDRWWDSKEDFAEHAAVCTDLVGSTEAQLIAQAKPEGPKTAQSVALADPLASRVAAAGKLAVPEGTAKDQENRDAREGIAQRLGIQTYQLFRLRYLFDLHEVLAQCGDDRTCATQLSHFFTPEMCRQFFMNEQKCESPVVVTPEAARAMKTWAKPSGHSERENPWEHEAFLRPETVFRPWLFQKMGVGLEVGRSDQGHAVTGLIGRIADWPFSDSRLELHAYFDSPAREGPVKLHRVGFDYHPSRAALFGIYFGFGYARSAERHLVASAGGELYLPNLPRLPRRLSMSIYAGLTGQVLRSTPEHELVVPTVSNVIPLQESDPVRIQFGLRLVYGFRGPPHPLAR